MASMDLAKISSVMDKFEKQFEDLDVQSQVMEKTMGNSTALTTPEDQVQGLMQAVADEHGLELNMQMSEAGVGIGAGKEKQTDELSERLAKLRNP